MQGEIEYPKLKILHVLTLNGRNGEYGGPVRVAREMCGELNRREHKTHIISGAIKGSEPVAAHGLSESFVIVKPISRKLPVSSLWSIRLVSQLKREIRKADVVHIHFARDLIPFLAAFLCSLDGKPFVTQTHGMINPDGRSSTRIVDFLLTRPLLNKSLSNLVLTESELKSITKLNITSPSSILPNGIFIAEAKIQDTKKVVQIAFCSRLEKRKGVKHFLDLVEIFKSSGVQFEIYGPDGGELSTVNEIITAKNIEKIVTYMGAIPAHEVQSVLKSVDLLVLPSRDEPFPMVVLEALAVGTPVLVMPSCGIATVLKEFRTGFVSKTEDIEGLIEALSKFLDDSQAESPESIQEFCRTQFSIESVCTRLISIYVKSKPALLGDSK